MIEVGRAALLLALALAVYAATAAVLGVRLGRPGLLQSARRASQATFVLVSVAVAALLGLLLRRDYQVLYVYEHVSSSLSNLYAASALWAGAEGSLLVWLWLLSLCALLVGRGRSTRAKEVEAYALAALSLTQGFFALVLCTVSAPFVLLPARAADGSGLNPLLQNPAMICHPPALLAGYAAYAVPFSYAFGALVSGRFEGQWLRSVRRWSLVAWAALGLGILMGARWAYVELGWGGFWAWDPVENASLVPWLMGTALLHAMAAWERRGVFRLSALALAIGTFVLCIVATAMARGDLVGGSLHTFAPSKAGHLFYGYAAALVVACSWLLLWRRRRLRSEVLQQALSREGVILVGNLLLVGLALAILVGTLFPVLTQALWRVRIALGGAFFERVTWPLALAGLLLMGVGPLLGWRRTDAESLRLALVPLGAAVATWLILLGLRACDARRALAFTVIAFAGAGNAQELLRAICAWQRLRNLAPWAVEAGHLRTNRRRYGMLLVHMGAVIVAASITGQGLYGTEREATLQRGQSASIGRYEVRFEALSSEMLPAQERHAATLGVYSGDRRVATLRPEYNYHHSVRGYVAEVAVCSTVREDLYVAITGIAEDTSIATFRLRLNPLMVWLWIGGAAIVPGTALILWPGGLAAVWAAVGHLRRHA
ncbi:MAG: cytochrome c biogenesis protein CcsA [Anaerolineae bacterium]|nr:cytochrome c biogenesis protein CcsA [Anaerolineae bacterium]